MKFICVHCGEKTNIREILAAKNTTKLVVEIRPFEIRPFEIRPFVLQNYEIVCSISYFSPTPWLSLTAPSSEAPV